MENNEYQWVSDFKVKIASYLKMKIPQSHPKAYVTDKSKDLSEPTFPTVYFHAMPFTETGQDLEARSVNGITASYQVDVITNKSQEEAEAIMATVAGLFKRLRFQITSMPEFNNTSHDTYRSTARFKRNVDADDIL